VLGRRVEKKVDGYSTRYVYDGPHVIAEYDGNNNLLRKYIYGPGKWGMLFRVAVRRSPRLGSVRVLRGLAAI